MAAGGGSPVWAASLMAPDFARFTHDGLGTPSLQCALRGEGLQLNSPLLSPKLGPHPGWTPSLLGNDAVAGLPSASLPRPYDQRPALHAGVAAEAPSLPVLPLSLQPPPLSLQPLPELSNYLMPSNVRQFTDGVAPMSVIKDELRGGMPPVPQVPQAGLASAASSTQPLGFMVPAEPASTTSAGSPGGSCGVTPGGSPCMADACLPGPLPAPPCQQTAPLLHTTALAAPTDAASRPTRPLSASCPRPASAAQRSASASAGSAGGSAGGCMGEEPDKRLNLEFLEEHGYFDMPIQQAAAELHVGVTTLKKVCRVNNIGRWPFRKRSSLNRLIEKTKEYFASDPEQCAEALAQLEAQRTVLREQQGEDIPDQVKRFRQSIFKLDYKVKKIAKERRTHKAPGPVDREQVAQVVRQLGVGTPAHSILGILHGTDAGCEPPHRSLRNTMDLDLAMSE